MSDRFPAIGPIHAGFPALPLLERRDAMLYRVLFALTVLAALAGGIAAYSVLTSPPAVADVPPSCNNC